MKKINTKIKINSGLPAQAGMTLIELLVVLGIFAVLSSVVIFNYGNFQSRIDITNLANDVALQVVQAQNSSIDGTLPIQIPNNPGYPSTPWKPSYGVYFSSTALPDIIGADNKDFVSFVDLDNTKTFDNGSASGSSCTQECLSKYTITKNDYISDISVFYINGTFTAGLTNLTVTFTRPDSDATFKSTPTYNSGLSISYFQITVVNPTGQKQTPAYIDLYPSGRVQIN
jgi:prepilin-type N-terminal cleavage/methylation domain-containing protein